MEQKDLQQELDIQPGQTWLCRDGVTKARIYATDGVGSQPIHGAIEDHRGWCSETWAHHGRFWSEGEHPYDLIRRIDWREELAPIWAVLKPEYRWVAMNASGQWLAFALRNRPARAESVFWSQGEHFPLHALRTPTPDCPWHETLTERPGQ